jgi:hypothetical protein
MLDYGSALHDPWGIVQEFKLPAFGIKCLGAWRLH